MVLTSQIPNRFMEDLESLAKLKGPLSTENKEQATSVSNALNTKALSIKKLLQKGKGLNR
jgi:hypothetical protein